MPCFVTIGERSAFRSKLNVELALRRGGGKPKRIGAKSTPLPAAWIIGAVSPIRMLPYMAMPTPANRIAKVVCGYHGRVFPAQGDEPRRRQNRWRAPFIFAATDTHATAAAIAGDAAGTVRWRHQRDQLAAGGSEALGMRVGTVARRAREEAAVPCISRPSGHGDGSEAVTPRLRAALTFYRRFFIIRRRRCGFYLQRVAVGNHLRLPNLYIREQRLNEIVYFRSVILGS